MNIRKDALKWFYDNHGTPDGPIMASKFYVPKESWKKCSVWFFEIPQETIEAPDAMDIHLVCQVAPNIKDFHYLRVPASFFKKNLPGLMIRNDNRHVSLILSAEASELFLDLRGTGKIIFDRFLQPGGKTAG